MGWFSAIVAGSGFGGSTYTPEQAAQYLQANGATPVNGADIPNATGGGLSGQGSPAIGTAPMNGADIPTDQGGGLSGMGNNFTTMPVARATDAGSYGNLSDPTAWMALVNNPQQLRSWVTAQAPQLFQNNPGLLDYYVQKIQQQPGANPTEQAGSAGYWTNKINQDPGVTGQSGGGSSSGIPGMDPGYDFRFQQGVRALQASAASRGTLLTGGTLKALADFGQQDASQEYANAFGRQLSLAQLGENAAAQTGNFGSSYANNAGNTITNNANAQGAAGIAQGNAWANALNTGGSLAALYGLQRNYGGGNTTNTYGIGSPNGYTGP